MAQAVAYSASEEKMMESEQEPEMDGVDPWKAAMQVQSSTSTPTQPPTWEGGRKIGACIYRGLKKLGKLERDLTLLLCL